MIAPRLLDANERKLAEEDLSTTYLVEAAAGTGKTGLLVDRILAAVRAGTPVSELAAITFTEKAAGELKQRLRTLMEDRRQTDEQNGHLYAAALTDLERAQISTIHSFCAWLLREYPVEAGVDPKFEVCDALESELMLEEVWDDWLPRQATELDPARSPLPRLLRAGADVEKLWLLAKTLAEKRDSLPKRVTAAPRSLAEILEVITSRVSELTRLRVHCATGDKLTRAIEDWERRITEWQRLSPWDGEALVLTAPLLKPEQEGKPFGDKKRWKPTDKFNQARKLGQEIEALRTQLADALIRDTLAWLEDFLTSYNKQRKTSRGRLDFNDLLRVARDLLRKDKEIRGRLQRRFRHLFVDEFQDTDPMQVEIVFFLAEKAPYADRWDECEMAAGKLFLVGDPKQSIYSFRGADIEIYERVAELISAKGGRVLNIRTSWRSTSTLLSWVNAMFHPLFGRPADGQYHPDYVALEALDAKKVTASAVWQLLPTTDQQQHIQAQRFANKSVAREFEADAIARCLRHLHDKEKRAWKEMAILFCTGSAQETFLDTLQNYGVPHRVLGGKDYYVRQEIRTLHSLLTCLDNPADTLHLVAVLRSPLFGWTDEQIYRAGQQDGLDYCRDEVSDPLQRATFQILCYLHEHRHDGSVAAFVETVFHKTKICEAFFVCSADGAQSVANLLKALELARRLEAAGVTSLRGFVRRLLQDILGAREEESSPTTEEGDDIVRVMTVHKAKGLDFPIVVMADLCGDTSDRGVRLLAGQDHRVLETRFGKLTTAGFNETAARQQRRDEKEVIRLLYVAATRAKDLLVVPWFIPKQEGRSGHLASGMQTILTSLREQKNAESFEAKRVVVRPLRTELVDDEDRKELATRQRWQDARAALMMRATQAPRRETPSSLGHEMERETEVIESAMGAAAREVGTFVHEVLERVDLRATTGEQQQQAEQMVEGATLDASEKARAIRLLRTALESPLFDRARAADQVERELPFSMRDGEVLLEGKIDLLFREKDKWVLVDYKTDRVVDAEKYREQFGAYARALERVARISPAEKILFFLENGKQEKL